MNVDHLLTSLDAEQQKAVLAPRGPVCILAGAGTGKTRTVTHRIAYGVLTGAVPFEQVLAVTHSQKAAGEMRHRLTQLGVGGVAARTFHSAALKQLRYFWVRTGREESLQILKTSDRYTTIRRALERPTGMARLAVTSEQVLDVASEIGWAKASLLDADTYPDAAKRANRPAPVAMERLAATFRTYEQLKDSAGRIDFEDMLRMTADLILQDAEVAKQVRGTYSSFVVDEYQDVDPLQQYLLDAWLGEGQDVCVVGDHRQSIYSFKGGDPTLIQGFAKKNPEATVVHLVKDYRSTPEVVYLANKVSKSPAKDALVGQRPSGPAPKVVGFDDEIDEEKQVAREVKRLVDDGTPASEIAVLYRFNSQSARLEGALQSVGVPYNVVDDERFFDRPEVRQVLISFGQDARSEPEEAGAYLLRLVLSEAGWDRDSPPPGAGAQRDRWESLSALISMVEDLPGAEEMSASALLQELQQRAVESQAPSLGTVQLSTIHKAKGLEWDNVFVVRCTEGSLPSAYAKTPAQIEEERNLLYVAVTRARERLLITWAAKRENGWRSKPSSFLVDLGLVDPAGSRKSSKAKQAKQAEGAFKRGRTADEANLARFGRCETCESTLPCIQAKRLGLCGNCLTGADAELYARVDEWRKTKAAEFKTSPERLISEAGMLAIVADKPRDMTGLGRIPSIDLTKRRTWGAELLMVIKRS